MLLQFRLLHCLRLDRLRLHCRLPPWFPLVLVILLLLLFPLVLRHQQLRLPRLPP